MYTNSVKSVKNVGASLRYRFSCTGTMRERINRLARGIIDSGIPELVLAPD